MAATDRVREFDHPRMRGHYSTDFLQGLEASGQTWKRGAPLVYSSGKLAEASSDVTSGILGFAVKDATGTADTVTDYIPAFEELELEGTLEDASSGDHTLAQTNVGAVYAFKKTAEGVWYLDENDTSGAAYVMRLVDPVGTVQGRVIFRVKRSTTAWA